MDGYDGYELEPGGRLILLNWDLFTGIKWEMNGKSFYTEMVYKKNGNVLKKTSEILSLTDKEMVLKTVTEDNEFVDTYVKIAYGTVADKIYGHYTNGSSYVQVIPVYEDEFQVVFCAHEQADVVKYFGRLNEATHELQFNRNGESVVLQHNFRGNKEELTVGDVTYYRPIM